VEVSAALSVAVLDSSLLVAVALSDSEPVMDSRMLERALERAPEALVMASEALDRRLDTSAEALEMRLEASPEALDRRLERSPEALDRRLERSPERELWMEDTKVVGTAEVTEPTRELAALPAADEADSTPEVGAAELTADSRPAGMVTRGG
jgi:hypothetical protein